MQARFLLGRAGAGKTFSCLAEARRALLAAPEGEPLLLLAPKQATFLLERQLLGGGGLRGYTRLRILSFERLANFVLTELRQPVPPLLSEQGRTMALRALLSRQRSELEIFRSSAGLSKFAQHLSRELRQWQRREFSPAALRALADRAELAEPLRRKLRDLARLLGDYLAWLAEREIQDGDCLLDAATQALAKATAAGGGAIPGFSIDTLWMDGFAEMAAQETSLLTAVARHCRSVTLAFCVDGRDAQGAASPLSIWSGVEQTRAECRQRLAALPGARLTEEILDGDRRGRFAAHAALGHLEKHWTRPEHFEGDAGVALEAAVCANPEAEAILAARKILRFVRDGGGRYRDAGVFVRRLDGWGEALRRVFRRYRIPFFLDRREPAASHPLAELTRNALRAVISGWRHEDWFAALKTGLVADDDAALDRVENEALSRGWTGETWFRPLPGESETDAERLRQEWIAPFARFRAAVGSGAGFQPAGEIVAEALRQLWRELRVEEKLKAWGGNVHATVWEQMNVLLDDLALAFRGAPLPLREWLTILDAGLGGLTVGVVPPSLDQVMIGAIDRSRSPELKLAILLGLNESVFPAPPAADALLNESDRDELTALGVSAGPGRLQWAGRENFLAYIACTRSRGRLVLGCSQRDGAGSPLNPSPFFAHFRRLFPTLALETFAGADWRDAEAPCELTERMAQTRPGAAPLLEELLTQPEFALLRDQKSRTSAPGGEDLAGLAEKLYGPALKTSVSRLEDYAACAFKFFARSGLRAEEREIFELDVRERGSFQHAALAAFHHRVRAQGREWRDLTPDEGRELFGQIIDEMVPTYRHGLLAANPRARFSARTVGETLREFIATTIEWMACYEFNPRAAEIAFGGVESPLPAWEMDLGGGRRLTLRGIIDRVDLYTPAGGGEALAVVVDYKSGARELDKTLLAHGLQLQLAAYLSALRHLPGAQEVFGVARLIPAGVFYVNLSGRAGRGETRAEVLARRREATQAAFQYVGRFDFDALPHLDNRGVSRGGQFKYRRKKDGQPYANDSDPMTKDDFRRLLDDVEAHMRRMGAEIYAGALQPNPFQKGNTRACDHCEFPGLCRFDPWTDPFRVLK